MSRLRHVSSIRFHKGPLPGPHGVIVGANRGDMGAPMLGIIERLQQIAKDGCIVDKEDLLERGSEPPHVIPGEKADCYNLAVTSFHEQGPVHPPRPRTPYYRACSQLIDQQVAKFGQAR